jgi:hypothetical protein
MCIATDLDALIAFSGTPLPPPTADEVNTPVVQFTLDYFTRAEPVTPPGIIG